MDKGNAPPRSILVVGGAGGLGSELCKHLCKMGERVIAVDDISSGTLMNIEDLYPKKSFQFMRENIANLNIPWNVGKIIFLPVPDKSCQLDVFNTNIDGLMNCLDYCSHNMCKIIYGSTSMPLSPIDGSQLANSYYLSRQYGESLVRGFYDKNHLGSAIVRIPSVYGPPSAGRGQILSRFIKEAVSKKEITVLKDENSSRAYLHSNDFTAALSEIIKIVDTGGLSVVDLAGSEVMTATEVAKSIAREIKENTGRTIAIRHMGRRYTHKRSVVSRGPSLIKNKPRIRLQDVLWRMIEREINEVPEAPYL
jgi:UDP-glucose 4-epimerase